MDTLIRVIEECSFRAGPALETHHYDGWLLRLANGYTRRANSINPVYNSSYEVEEKLAYCEAFYQQKGLPVCFKMTSAVYPENLDDILDARSYTRDAPTSVQLLDLSEVDTHLSDDVVINEHVDKNWLADFVRLNNVDTRHLSTMRQMLRLITPPAAFITLCHGHDVVAVGLGVQDGEYLGLFDIVTDARWRGQGFGTNLIQSLLHWGKSEGAGQAYLQVMLNNPPALRLYEKLGFREVYQYWYRVKS